MPTPKTECTELSVALGLLGAEPIGLRSEQIQRLFDGTLDPEKYSEFARHFSKEESFFRKFYSVGVNLRSTHPLFALSNISSVRWEGPNQQARSVSMAIDILAANTPISIKADSNVVFNLSPHTLFVSIPSGTAALSRAPNWYWTASPDLCEGCACST